MATSTSRSGKAWTANELRLLRALRHEGLVAAEIAKRLRRSKSSINNQVQLLNARSGRQLSPRKCWTEEDDRRLEKLHSEGVTIPEISGILDRTQSSVKNRLSKQPTRTSYQPWSTTETTVLFERTEQRVPVNQIAKELRRSRSDVINRRREVGLVKGVHPWLLWTHEEDKLLMQMVQSNHQVSEIVSKLGRSRRSIQLRRFKLIQMGELVPPEMHVTYEAIAQCAEGLWRDGRKPTQRLVASLLGVGPKRIYEGFRRWTRECGRSRIELHRGPAAIATVDAFRKLLPKELRHLANTCLDLQNGERWKKPHERLILFLSKVEPAALRNCLAFYVFPKARNTGADCYSSIVSFNRLWNRLRKEDSSLPESPAEVPHADELLLDVIQNRRGGVMTPYQRASVVSVWTMISNAQHDYLEELRSSQARQLQKYCLDQVTSSRKLSKQNHWSKMVDAQQKRVRAQVEMVHGKFHQLRFAAQTRLNAVRRMVEAYTLALERAKGGAPLPLSFSYEEKFVEVDGRTYEQTVHMEVWDYKSIFSKALESGYKTDRARLREFQLGTWPGIDNGYLARLVKVARSNGKPGRRLWVFELIEAGLFSYVEKGTLLDENLKEFNEKWGYKPGRLWTPPRGMMTIEPSVFRPVMHLAARSHYFFDLRGLYLMCLFAVLDVRIQTVSGARIGEVLQIAVSPECIVPLRNVGPKKKTRWFFRAIPKGRTDREDYAIDDDTKDLLLQTVRELRDRYGEEKIPVVPGWRPRMPHDRYIFQWRHIAMRCDELNRILRIILHGVVPGFGASLDRDLHSHLLRHSFATEAKERGVSLDVLATILHHRSLDATRHYSKPTKKAVTEAAELMFIESIDFSRPSIRTPDEVSALLREAEGKVGAFTEVIGGTCTVANMCGAKFSCIGCGGNAPDPAKRAQVEAKKAWALVQVNFAKKEKLPAEERQMSKLVEDCDLLLEEMDLISAAREDAAVETVVKFK